MSKKTAQKERMRLWTIREPFCNKAREYTVPDEDEHEERSDEDEHKASHETPKKAATNATQSSKSPQSAEKSVETHAQKRRTLRCHETVCESPKFKRARKVDAPSFPKRAACLES